MEAEERPAKMRKLSKDVRDGSERVPEEIISPSIVQSAASSDQAARDTALVSAQTPEAEAADNHEGISLGDEEPNAEDQLPAPEETAPSLAAVEVKAGEPSLSKNQLKKLRKKAEWEAKRGERKIVRKEKLVAKRERKRAAKQEKAEAGPDVSNEPRKAQLHRHGRTLPVTFIIDCDFDDLMRDNERNSLATQITRSYSDNRNSLFRAHLTICSFGGALRTRFDTLLNSNYKSWKGVRTFECDFVETAEKAKGWMREAQGNHLAGVFSPYADANPETHSKLKEEGEVVYLTSEANEDLTELKPYSTYIIGGLVDKNREKGICFKRATQRNVRTAKLPIGKYMDMQSRKVLATNHVNEIMLKWLECGDWGDAFMKVVPKRKGGKLKATRDQHGQQGPEQAQEQILSANECSDVPDNANQTLE